MLPKPVGPTIFIASLFLCLSLLACGPTVDNPPALPVDVLQSLLAEKRYTEAIDLLEKSAANRSDDPVPLIKIGQIYLKQHRWLPAEDAFNRALVRQPDSALATAGLAEIRLNQGDWVQAESLWQKAADLNPNLPGVFTGLGRTYLFRLEFDAARAAFLKQLDHTPDPEARWYLAALAAPENVDAANDDLLAIPPEAPADVLAQRDYLLATLVPFTGQSPQAEVAKAVGVALVQVKLWPLAINALQVARSKKTGGEDAETLAFLGHALAQAGRPALALFEQARQLDPNSALPLYFYSIYLRQQNALNAAEALFKQAIQLDPDNPAIYAELAQTKVEQGDFAAAEAQFEAAVGAADNDPAMQMLRVRFHGGRGYRVEEAGIPAAQAVIKADDTNAEAYDWLGWMYYITGHPDKAGENLRKAIELNPDLASAHYRLGRLLEESAPEDAAKQYHRAVDLDIEGYYRQEAQKGLQRLETTTDRGQNEAVR